MYSYSINIVALVVAVIVTIILGMIWYSPLLFGNKWAELAGLPKEVTPEMKKRGNKLIALMIIPAIVQNYVLGLFISNMFTSDLGHAVIISIFAWVGFVATSSISEYLFNSKPKPWMLYFINGGYYLVSYIICAAILYILR